MSFPSSNLSDRQFRRSTPNIGNKHMKKRCRAITVKCLHNFWDIQIRTHAVGKVFLCRICELS